MAIDYKPVGWDANKYVNPTSMNHMDEGIKAACDKADANEAAIADVNNNLTTITRKVVTTELFGSHIQYGTATCVKIGRIVWLHINVTFDSAINTYGEVLGKLPVEFAPLESFTYGLTPSNTQSTASNYFEITSNGDSICYNSPDTRGVYNFCGAYISKS